MMVSSSSSPNLAAKFGRRNQLIQRRERNLGLWVLIRGFGGGESSSFVRIETWSKFWVKRAAESPEGVWILSTPGMWI